MVKLVSFKFQHHEAHIFLRKSQKHFLSVAYARSFGSTCPNDFFTCSMLTRIFEISIAKIQKATGLLDVENAAGQMEPEVSGVAAQQLILFWAWYSSGIPGNHHHPQTFITKVSFSNAKLGLANI